MLIKILSYFVPFAINFLSGGFFFISAYRFAKAGCSALICGSGVTCWGLVYCIASLFLGKAASTKNALKFIIAGGLVLSLTSCGFILLPGLYMQFIWLATAGIGAALFCTPFQLFAKSLESSGDKINTVKASALYTASWSVGLASGPLAFARLKLEHGFLITLALALGVTFMMLLVALLLRGKKRTETVVSEKENEPQEPDFSDEYIQGKSSLAVLGWLIGCAGTFVVSIVRGLWPKHAEVLGISQAHTAYVLALVSYTQALTAILFCGSKQWMYRRNAAIWVGIAGIVAMLLFAYSWICGLFYLAAIFCGIYSGSIYFYLVFHSLDHPIRPQYFVAGNEVVVGVTCIIAPLAGGITADIAGTSGSPFVLAAAAIALTTVVQLAVLTKLALQKRGII